MSSLEFLILLFQDKRIIKTFIVQNLKLFNTKILVGCCTDICKSSINPIDKNQSIEFCMAIILNPVSIFDPDYRTSCMKKLVLLPLILPLLFSQPTNPVHPIEVDVRKSLFQDDLLKVMVQIENASDRNIELLEGFLTIIDNGGNIIKEVRMQVVQSTDPVFAFHSSISDSKTFPYKTFGQANFLFHINKIRFQGDYRLYTYHPAVGLIRID